MINNTCGRVGGDVLCCAGVLVGPWVCSGVGDSGCAVGDNVGAPVAVELEVMLGAGVRTEPWAGWLLLPQAASSEAMTSTGSI
jgi:hypothetical protein